MPATMLDAPAMPAASAPRPAPMDAAGLTAGCDANAGMAHPGRLPLPPRPLLPSVPVEPRLPLPPVALCPGWASAIGTLDAGLGRCRRQARLASVLWVDMALDDPDVVRSLMQAMGQRLRHRVRATDSVMQVGCEAFAVLLVDAGDQASAVVRERLHEVLQQPYRLGDGRTEPLMLRVGRAVYGLDGQEARDLLRVAARLGAADI